MAAAEQLGGRRRPAGPGDFLNSGLGPAGDDDRGAALYEFACTAGGDVVRGRRVLDVGCYRGGGVRLLATALGAAEAVGVDFVARWVEAAREAHGDVPAASFRHAEAAQVSRVFGKGEFDTVIFVQTLKDAAAGDGGGAGRVLRAVNAVLRPGGVLAIAELAAWLPADLRAALDDAGFEIVVWADVPAFAGSSGGSSARHTHIRAVKVREST